MTKRTISVFRFKGYELQSNFPIGSAEFDKAVTDLCEGYLNIPGAKIHVQGEPHFNPKVTPGEITAIASNEKGALGMIPVKLLWIEDVDLSETEEGTIVYPKVFHHTEGFVGRIEVEEQSIELSVV